MDTTERPSKYCVIGPAVAGVERGLIGCGTNFSPAPNSAEDAGPSSALGVAAERTRNRCLTQTSFAPAEDAAESKHDEPQNFRGSSRY